MHTSTTIFNIAFTPPAFAHCVSTALTQHFVYTACIVFAVPKQQPADLLVGMEGLSARERNQAKRRAKAMARADSNTGRGGCCRLNGV